MGSNRIGAQGPSYDVLLCVALLLGACSSKDAPAVEETPTTKPPTEGSKAVEAPGEGPADKAAAQRQAAADPDEACARILVVSWQGAPHAQEHITRSQEEAKARAETLRTQALADAAGFGRLAKEQSDAPTSAARDGLVGTFTRDEWPPIHEALRDPVLSLELQAISDVIEAPYGYVIAQRCSVEKAHARHILVRYQGAARAEDTTTRSKEEARALAERLKAQLAKPDADFAALAKEHSDDGSAERGGDLGKRGRGLFVPAFEDALFALEPNGISDVVETEMGFHLIQRLPD